MSIIDQLGHESQYVTMFLKHKLETYFTWFCLILCKNIKYFSFIWIQTLYAFHFCSDYRVHGKTGKSVQEQIDKFSIIQSDTEDPSSNMLHHTENFIKTEVS